MLLQNTIFVVALGAADVCDSGLNALAGGHGCSGYQRDHRPA